MPANASKKGTASKNTSARERRSMSRHSTPLSSTFDDPTPSTPQAATPAPPTSQAKETAYIKTPIATLVSNDPSIGVLIEKSANHGPNPAATTVGASKGDYPPAKDLHALHDRIRNSLNKFMVRRGTECERGIRQVVLKGKERIQIEQEEEEAQRAEAAAAAARAKREEEDHQSHREKKEKKKLNRKRSHDEMEVDEEESEEKKQNLPSVGAHGVARQDGVGVHEGAQAPPSPPVQPGTVPAEPMDEAASPSNTEASEPDQPSAAPLYERTFGKDPTQFDDPTIYDIKEVLDDMTRDEKEAIFNVAQWPESDLRDITAGDPPDADFSNAKPANQVNFATFQGYVEPYIRAFTEEDVAFLKERGDRTTPYVTPARGTRGYKEVWASEDGTDGIAPPRKQKPDPNEARGSMEDMNDETAETDEVSMGPVMNRMLSIIRPNPNGVRKDGAANGNEDADGDTSMVNGDNAASATATTAPPLPDLTATTTATSDQQQQPNGTTTTAPEEQKPTTALPPETPRPATLPQLDYDTLDQRALQELRYLGFLSATDAPAFDTFDDDEVAARLRTLQEALRRVARTNNIRRARVLELTEERMAMQEYANIADDLDTQVNAAYSKRNRLAKPGGKKSGGSAARPGGQKGVAGLAGAGGGRGVSEGTKALMQKRRDWIDMVGPVVAYGRPPIPGDGATIFDEASLKRLEKVEREAEAGEGEGE